MIRSFLIQTPTAPWRPSIFFPVILPVQCQNCFLITHTRLSSLKESSFQNQNHLEEGPQMSWVVAHLYCNHDRLQITSITFSWMPGHDTSGTAVWDAWPDNQMWSKFLEHYNQECAIFMIKSVNISTKYHGKKCEWWEGRKQYLYK